MSDLISRQVLLLRLADWQLQESPNWGASGMGDAKVYETLKGVEEMIQELPTIEPKKGKWKPFDLTWGRSVWACDACGETVDVPTLNGKPIFDYCPWCGAKMERSEE